MSAVFTFTWNGTFESQPADVEDASLGALRIRNFKAAFAERFKIDHQLPGDGNDGKHLKVTLPISTGDPTLDTNDICIYAKQIEGLTELFVRNSNNDVIQITRSGQLNSESFPTNTKMLFLQAAVPSGWTLDNGFHDRVFRIVDGLNGVGGALGGSWQITGLSADAHVLTVDEIPPHTHLYTRANASGTGEGFPGSATMALDTTQTGSAGGGGGHTHGVSSNATWRPLYVNTIVGIKNAPGVS
jgi:hypothetical protein